MGGLSEDLTEKYQKTLKKNTARSAQINMHTILKLIQMKQR